MELRLIRQRFSHVVEALLYAIGALLLLWGIASGIQSLIHRPDIAIPVAFALGAFLLLLLAVWILVRVIRHAWRA